MSLEHARRVADAVLYEGYVLYPYRASARKNRLRWQFGVVAPREWSEATGTERWWSQTSFLVDPASDAAARIHGCVRFLRTRRRTVERCASAAFEPVESLEVGTKLWTAWDEGVETEIPFAIDLESGAAEEAHEIRVRGERSSMELRDSDGPVLGRVTFEERPLYGWIRVHRETKGRYRALRITIENHSHADEVPTSRDDALAAGFLGAHVLLQCDCGHFVSLTDPPPEASDVAAQCVNVGLWPVLAGDAEADDLLLCSPIILEDHPKVAPESSGDFFDATEIDEMLTLRTLTLTEQEKREARATDPRSAAILDRVEALSEEELARLHGILHAADELLAKEEPLSVPSMEAAWWDPDVDGAASPDSDSIDIGGVTVRRGSRVRLHPNGHSDAQDMFVDGRIARVEGVFFDVESRPYLAVTVVGDPLADLQAGSGRFRYFAPDEVEPMESRG